MGHDEARSSSASIGLSGDSDGASLSRLPRRGAMRGSILREEHFFFTSCT